MDQNWPPEKPEETLSLVRRRAKRLVGKANLPPTEVDELEQHISVELWKQSERFDPAQGNWLDFAKARTYQICSKYVRHIHAAKRDRRRCQSLHDPIRDPEGRFVELGDTISGAQVRRHRCYESGSSGPESMEEFRQLVEHAPPEWRDTLFMLSNGTVSSVAKSIGMKRTTFSSRDAAVASVYAPEVMEPVSVALRAKGEVPQIELSEAYLKSAGAVAKQRAAEAAVRLAKAWGQ